MAKRRMSRKRRSPQRSELVLNFPLTADGTNYINIPYALSLVNRKLFRAARTYAVAGVSLYTYTEGNVNVQISTLPDNWTVNNSVTKAYHLWKQMNDKVLDDNPSIAGTWADFKPSFDAAHTVIWQAGNPGIRPIDSGYVFALAGEWEQAEIVLPQHSVDGSGDPLAAVTRYLHVLGADDVGNDTLGIAHGYQSTRSTVQAEDPADDPVDASNWMITLFDEGSSDPELATTVMETNDRPPYDQDEYPGADLNYDGGQFQSYLATSYTLATGASKTSDHDNGFLAPCGLLKVVAAGTSATEVLQIRLVPGSYNGCMSESMV